MNYNKKTLRDRIDAMLTGMTMASDIEHIIKEFEHYKKVDKRFCDALNRIGYSSYIVKDKYSTVFFCNGRADNNDRVEFRVYQSEVMERNPFTWDRIRAELQRYNFQGAWEAAKRQLEIFDEEKVKLEQLAEYLESVTFSNFDIGNAKWCVEEAVRIANRE